jgi:hypothetical protein
MFPISDASLLDQLFCVERGDWFRRGLTTLMSVLAVLNTEAVSATSSLMLQTLMLSIELVLTRLKHFLADFSLIF